MGYQKQTLSLLFDLFKSSFNSFQDIHMLELGDQFIDWEDCNEYATQYSFQINSKNASIFFKHIHINSISLDYNKQENTFYYDLRNLEHLQDIAGKFNIITDIGTLEHVGQDDTPEKFLENQYNALKNIHYFGMEGCIYYHVVPLKGYWYKHGACDYTVDFWRDLCILCSYEIIRDPFIIDYCKDLLVGVIYKKTKSSIFPSFKEFCKLKGLRSTFND